MGKFDLLRFDSRAQLLAHAMKRLGVPAWRDASRGDVPGTTVA